MSNCISSHGEYDSHETDPGTFVCKWCHEFDEAGALAEIARLRRAPVTGMEHAIEQAARVLALTDDYDGCFECIDAWEAATDEQRECREVEEPMTSDEEDCEFWRRRARALAEAGLIAPAPLTEEWSAAFTGIAPDGTEHIRLIGTPGGREHAQETCDDCNADDPDVLFFLVRRPVHDWMPVNPAEGDGRADADRAADAIQAVLDGRAEVRWCAAEEVPSEGDGRADQ